MSSSQTTAFVRSGHTSKFGGWLDNDGLYPRALIVVFLMVAAAVVLRRPDALLNPQFHGEDGPVWFSEAYSRGWFNPLLTPSGGYFNTLPRLIANLATLVPFRYTPLCMNLCGIALQALPVIILLSTRCVGWGKLPVRALMAASYVALPNSSEINVTATNAQFHLALAVAMISFAKPPHTKGWKIFDFAATLVCGLTGPFCLVLCPLLLFFGLKRKQPWTSLMTIVLALCSLIQASELLHSAARTRTPLGASLLGFLRILDGQVYMAALLGNNTFNGRSHYPGLLLIAAIGTAFIVFCILKAGLELKLFVVLSIGLFVAALHNPLIDSPDSAWEILRQAWGMRYWFFPMLAFLWSLIWCATTPMNPLALRVFAAALALFSIRGMVRDWDFIPYADRNFPQSADAFEAAAPGSFLTVPVEPIPWVMRITKRAPHCGSLPIGSLEAPQANQTVSGPVAIGGWVTDTRLVTRVSVYIDQSLAQSGTLNTPRPDVDKLYPPRPNSVQGWTMLVDYSRFRPGNHVLHVRSMDSKSCDAEFAQTPIVIAATSKAK